MKKMLMKTSLLSLGTALLLSMAGCGSGSGNNTGGVKVGASGTGSDGILSGSNVFIDSNGNGVYDAGEANATTDAQGHFTIAPTTQRGPLVLVGGKDVGTGLAFNGTLKAPVGSTVVTPLTSAVQALVESGKTAAQAETDVKNALGLKNVDVNLTTYDPFNATQDAKSQAVLASQAHLQTIVQAAAVTVASADANKSAADVMGKVFSAISTNFSGATQDVNITVAQVTNATKTVANTVYANNLPALVSVKNNAQTSATTAVTTAEHTKTTIEAGSAAQAQTNLNAGITLVNTTITDDINKSVAQAHTAANDLNTTSLQVIVDAQKLQEEKEAAIEKAVKDALAAQEAQVAAQKAFDDAKATADAAAQKAAYDKLLKAQAEELIKAKAEADAKATRDQADANAKIKEAQLKAAADIAKAKADAEDALKLVEAKAKADAEEADAKIAAAEQAAKDALAATSLADAEAAQVSALKNAQIIIINAQAQAAAQSIASYLQDATDDNKSIVFIQSLDSNYSTDSNISTNLGVTTSAISNIETLFNDANTSATQLNIFANSFTDANITDANITDANSTLQIVLEKKAAATTERDKADKALNESRTRVAELDTEKKKQEVIAKVEQDIQDAKKIITDNNVSALANDINSSLSAMTADLNATLTLAESNTTVVIDTKGAKDLYDKAFTLGSTATQSKKEIEDIVTFIDDELVKAQDGNTTEAESQTKAEKAKTAFVAVKANREEIKTLQTQLANLLANAKKDVVAKAEADAAAAAKAKAEAEAKAKAQAQAIANQNARKIQQGDVYNWINFNDNGIESWRTTLTSGTAVDEAFILSQGKFVTNTNATNDYILENGSWVSDKNSHYTIDTNGIATLSVPKGEKVKIVKVLNLANPTTADDNKTIQEINAQALKASNATLISVSFSTGAEAYVFASQDLNDTYRLTYTPKDYSQTSQPVYSDIYTFLQTSSVDGVSTGTSYKAITAKKDASGSLVDASGNVVSSISAGTNGLLVNDANTTVGTWKAENLPNGAGLAVILTRDLVNFQTSFQNPQENLITLKDGVVYLGEKRVGSSEYKADQDVTYNATAYADFVKAIEGLSGTTGTPSDNNTTGGNGTTGTPSDNNTTGGTGTTQSTNVENGITALKAVNLQTESLTDKILEVRNTLGTTNPDEVLFGALLDIADIVNSSEVKAFLDVNTSLPYLDAFSGNAKLLVDIRNGVTMIGGTNIMHTMATKLKSASDAIETAFTNHAKVVTYDGITINYDDSLSIRAEALATASTLDLLASYTYGDVSFVQKNTQVIDGVSYEYINAEIDPLSLIQQSTFFKMADTSRLANAGAYLSTSVDLIASITVANLNTKDINAQDIADATKIQTALAADGNYSIDASTSVNLKKLFSATEYIDRNDFNIPTTYLGKSAAVIAEYDKAVSESQALLAFAQGGCTGTQPTNTVDYNLLSSNANTTPVDINTTLSIKHQEPTYDDRGTILSVYIYDTTNCGYNYYVNNYNNPFLADFNLTKKASFDAVIQAN